MTKEQALLLAFQTWGYGPYGGNVRTHKGKCEVGRMRTKTQFNTLGQGETWEEAFSQYYTFLIKLRKAMAKQNGN